MYQLNSATNTLESNVRVTATATKVCLANGQWYTNPNDIPESNYSLCELSNAFIARDFMEAMGDGTSNSQDYGNFEPLLLAVRTLNLNTIIGQNILSIIYFTIFIIYER